MCRLNIAISKDFDTKEKARQAFTKFKQKLEEFEPVEVSGEIALDAEKEETPPPP